MSEGTPDPKGNAPLNAMEMKLDDVVIGVLMGALGMLRLPSTYLGQVRAGTVFMAILRLTSGIELYRLRIIP